MDRNIFEWIMGMKDASWKRHENPLSGWTRVLILPLLSLAIWSRLWIGWWALVAVGLVMLFTWFNPRLFAPPETDDAWMTRGVRGERIWLARKNCPIPPEHARIAGILMLVSFLGIIPFAHGLVFYELPWLFLGLALMMGGKLWFIDRMVWLYEISKSGGHTGVNY